ncbi:MAG: hypothetical protein AAFP70_00430 [Calditrichota bacterium]
MSSMQENSVGEAPNAEELLKPDSTLHAMVREAYERRDYKEVKRIARELNERFPDSYATADANSLVAAIENRRKGLSPSADEVLAASRTSTTNSQPARQQPRKPTARKTPSRSSNSTSGPAVSNTVETAQNRLALARMRVVREPDQNITWYYNKHISHFVYKNSLESYIGQSDNGDIWLRMRIYYSGESSLNIQGYEIYADDRVYPIKTRYGNLEQGSGPGGSWEWFDMQVHSKDLEILKAAMRADRAAVKYIGAESNSERVLSEGEKARLLDVVRAMEALSDKGRYFAGNAPRPQ